MFRETTQQKAKRLSKGAERFPSTHSGTGCADQEYDTREDGKLRKILTRSEKLGMKCSQINKEMAASNSGGFEKASASDLDLAQYGNQKNTNQEEIKSGRDEAVKVNPSRSWRIRAILHAVQMILSESTNASAEFAVSSIYNVADGQVKRTDERLHSRPVINYDLGTVQIWSPSAFINPTTTKEEIIAMSVQEAADLEALLGLPVRNLHERGLKL